MKKSTFIGFSLTLVALSVFAASNEGVYYNSNPTDTSIYTFDGNKKVNPFWFNGYYGVAANTNTSKTTNVVIRDSNTDVSDIVGGGYNSTVGGTYVRLEGGKISDMFIGGGRGNGDTTYFNTADDSISTVNASVNGDIKIEMTGGTVSTWVVGGNYASTGSVNGNIDIKVTGGEIKYGIRAGSNGGAFEQVVNGNANVYIGGNAIVGGVAGEESFSSAGSYAKIGDLTLTIADKATVKTEVYGGGGRTLADNSYMNGTNLPDNVYANSVKNVEINVKGGNVESDIYGGAVKYSAVENTKINVSGGNIKSNVYAGGDKYTLVKQNTEVNLSGGIIEGDVFGSGSKSTSKTLGDSTITLSRNAEVKGTIYGNMEGAVVEGTKTLNVGSVDSVANTESAYVGTVKVANFNTINVQAGSNVEFASYKADSTGTTININKGSTLSVVLAKDIFTPASTIVKNAGDLILKKGSLIDGSSVSMSYTGNETSKVITYGGTFKDGTFTVSETNDVILGENKVQKIVDNGNVAIKDSGDNTQVEMSFNAAEVEITKVVEVKDESLKEISDKGISDITAYSFDVTGLDSSKGESVVLSFFIGNEALLASDFSIFHRADGEAWKDADVTDITYDGTYLSFIATHFSDYAVGLTNQVPEPAEWAAVFGAIALALGIYRRCK